MQRRRVLQTLGMAAGAHLGPSRFLTATASEPAVEQDPAHGLVGPEAFFNQLGYRPGDRKVATVRGAAPGQTHFRVRQADDNKVVFEGPLTAPQPDAASGDLVQLADFSALHAPYSYRIEFGGQGTYPFPVSERVYAGALRTAMRAFTGQRCGCSVDLGEGYQHPACHRNGAYGPTSGRSGTLANHGGWHDAGDYGRYLVNSGITCGTLLWAWELFPQVLAHLDLGIARQHGNLPGFLEEVLWNLGWMLQLQEPDGGVFHKQTSNAFCGFVLPQDDPLVSQVIGTGAAPYKSTAATADFAAVMAIASRTYAPFDRRLAAQFLAAARQAWTWAVAHPRVSFRNPPGVSTGEYGDARLADELLWASAELWRTTGEPSFEQAFLRGLPPQLDDLRVQAPSWSDVGALACWTYALAQRPGHPQVHAAIRRQTEQAAESLAERSRRNGYGNTLALDDFVWGSNGVAGNQSLLLGVAHHLEPRAEFAAAALANLHYLLGRNCFGVSWVTQLGTGPFLHPHHRPSAADTVAAPWPGLLSGGPNRHGGDPIADALPKGPPMRLWVDHTMAYSLNEVAINWNAPLMFLLAFANSAASLT